jgi:hypothetical protein
MYNDEVGHFEGLYGQASPDMSYFEHWGHFSQIVWKATSHVGCATVVCDRLQYRESAMVVPFTVCNYWPPGQLSACFFFFFFFFFFCFHLTGLKGNYVGEYADNIARPLGYEPYSP